MPTKPIASRIVAYKRALANSDIQKTYQTLVGMVQSLRTDFAKAFGDEFTVAHILHGYIDVTYFYLQNAYLKKKKLKFAIVLNHQQVAFELWLLGQTKDVQTIACGVRIRRFRNEVIRGVQAWSSRCMLILSRMNRLIDRLAADSAESGRIVASRVPEVDTG